MTKVETGDNVSPKLAVLVHDFENIDPAVMHDVFYICRYALLSEILEPLLKSTVTAYTFLASRWYSSCPAHRLHRLPSFTQYIPVQQSLCSA